MRLIFDLSELIANGFNPRICKRCDFSIPSPTPSSVRFNPRICKRCDLHSLSVHHTATSVSIHASVKDATFPQTVLFWQLASFNPRICKRCDFNVTDSEGRPVVSIHASVKDATLFFFELHKFSKVSIHASVKDATLYKNLDCIFFGFNPRICKRCDKRAISNSYSSFSFNPRICKRCDDHPRDDPLYPFGFNPRICKRCDSQKFLVSILLNSFNPRICKRCDNF